MVTPATEDTVGLADGGIMDRADIPYTPVLQTKSYTRTLHLFPVDGIGSNPFF